MTNIERTIHMGEYVPTEGPPAAVIYVTSIEEPRESSAPEEKEQSLQGNKPKEFNGSRKDSEMFMDHFNVYWRINRRNRNMKEPYTRVLMAISFINGPKVQDWTTAQVKKLNYAVETLGEDPQSESLWRNFWDDFIKAFTDTTQKQNAYTKLKNLKMEKDDLDTYIVTHENLVNLAEWDLEDNRSIEAFKNGLKRQLCLAILKQDNTPETLDEWKRAAIKEQQKWALIQVSDALPPPRNNGRQDKWKNTLKQGSRQGKPKDPDAMDVDNTWLNPLSDEDRKKLMSKGQCFWCRLQGHMSRDCFKKGQNPQTNHATTKKTTRSRTTEVINDRDDISKAGTDNTKVNTTKLMSEAVVRALKNLSKKQRDEVLNRILLKGEDF